jgi:hypothetical protein
MPSVITHTRGVQNHLTLWNAEWIARDPSRGRLTFTVQKPIGGLIVAFTDHFGSQSDFCLAAVIDSGQPRWGTYFTDFPFIDKPNINSTWTEDGRAMLRKNVNDVAIEWYGGVMSLEVDGRQVALVQGRYPGKYIAFGSLGSLDVGARGWSELEHLGVIDNVRIQ